MTITVAVAYNSNPASLDNIEQLIISVLAVIPKFIEFKDAALKPVTDAIARNKDSLTILYNFIKDFVVPALINNLGGALGFIGKVAGGVLDVIGFVVDGIKSAVNFAIDAINVLIRAYNAVPLLPNVATISKPSFSAPSTRMTAEEIEVRIWAMVIFALLIILVGSMGMFLYSVTYVTQPMSGMALFLADDMPLPFLDDCLFLIIMSILLM